jgi:DNA-binding MarR family transcriptional regulator
MSTKWRAPGDYVRDQAGAALGARLRRISDRIDREADALYQALHLDFEQRWFGVVNQLVLHQTRTVGEIAEALGVSHAAVSQVRSALAESGLLVAEIDPADARKRVLKLSAAGKRLALKLAPIWSALNDAARELDAEANGVARVLERLEAALDRRSLTDRVRTRL